MIHINSLYPGREIILAVQNGTEGKLSTRLKETLKAARSISNACKSSNPRDTAEKKHDAISACVSYAAVSEHIENDTAIGVLLNGKADCDGYSDAFYLVGTLAGLRVRYQHGKGVNSGFYGFMDATTHMWNLLEFCFFA